MTNASQYSVEFESVSKKKNNNIRRRFQEGYEGRSYPYLVVIAYRALFNLIVNRFRLHSVVYIFLSSIKNVLVLFLLICATR